MNRPGFLIPVLVLVSLFFGWRAYDAWTGPLKTAASVPPGSMAAPIGVSPEDAPPPADLHVLKASVASRPVFRPDRQPFREEMVQTPKRNYDAEISRLTLLGVLLMGKDKKGVVTGKGSSGRDERWEVAPGDALPGFIVKDIGSDGITLTADGRDFLLPLYAGGPKGQGPLRTETAPKGTTTAAPAAPGPAKTGSAPAAAQPARTGTVGGTPATTPPPAAVTPAKPGQSYPPRYRGRVRYPGTQPQN